MKKYLFLILTLVVIVTGCNEKEIKLSDNAKIANNHLEQSGYEVISYQGDSWQEFNKTDLRTLPDRQVWSVQYIEPGEYLNKKIETVKFTIKNHPLDELFKMGKTSVTVWLIENEVIGGWSYPISKNDDVVGAPYSLDGKTAEEVKGNYSTWLEEWKNKYGK